jgi:hypothetical protein
MKYPVIARGYKTYGGVTPPCVVHSTWSSQAMWQMHAPTFNKWHKKNKKTNKNKKVTLHMLTHSAMQGCGLTSLVVCINDKVYDIREGNVTIRSEISIMNVCSLGFQDIRECVTLWRLILWSLGCSFTTHEGGVESPKIRDPSLSSIIGTSQSSLVSAVDGAHPPIQGLTTPRV